MEIFHNNQWGTICDDSWDNREGEARVICKQLGFADTNFPAAITGGANLEESFNYSKPIWLDDVACSGSEKSIVECLTIGDWGLHNCEHSEDAGVRCLSIPGKQSHPEGSSCCSI